MKLAYDQETDSVYVNLRSGPAQDSREIAPDVVADFDAEGWLTGLDIQHASTTIELSHGSSLPERTPIQSRPFPAASADSASAPSSASPAAAGERFPR